jgi:hypothetical protein
MRRRLNSMIVTLVALLVAATSVALAQPPSESAGDLVRRTVRQEIEASENSTKFMFRERKESPAGSQTELLVETREAMAGMIIANNDLPLNADQQRAECARIDRFVREPEELGKKKASERENVERITKIVKALPDAFLYEFDGTETGDRGVGAPGALLLRLRFKPNPKYQPPSRVEQVLTGMEGTLLVDTKQGRIAKIDGTLAKEVGFGWGILGHLNPGGRFLVNQADVDGGHWEVTRMQLKITGKVLFFKTLNYNSTTTYSDFHPAPPNLSFAEGVEFLKKQQATLAKNEQEIEAQKKQVPNCR